MRRLAFRVFGQRRASAEDVAQDACLAALLRPEKQDDIGPRLADAVRRLACKMRLSQRDRREREKRAARPEAQPSTAEVVAQLEALRRLHLAVGGLPEPYRTEIRMRYFDGNSAQGGCPVPCEI